VPPSETSDTDDHDSVHSLPVGSTRTKVSTPAHSVSSGHTPQASYADIARHAAALHTQQAGQQQHIVYREHLQYRETTPGHTKESVSSNEGDSWPSSNEDPLLLPSQEPLPAPPQPSQGSAGPSDKSYIPTDETRQLSVEPIDMPTEPKTSESRRPVDSTETSKGSTKPSNSDPTVKSKNHVESICEPKDVGRGESKDSSDSVESANELCCVESSTKVPSQKNSVQHSDITSHVAAPSRSRETPATSKISVAAPSSEGKGVAGPSSEGKGVGRKPFIKGDSPPVVILGNQAEKEPEEGGFSFGFDLNPDLLALPGPTKPSPPQSIPPPQPTSTSPPQPKSIPPPLTKSISPPQTKSIPPPQSKSISQPQPKSIPPPKKAVIQNHPKPASPQSRPTPTQSKAAVTLQSKPNSTSSPSASFEELWLGEEEYDWAAEKEEEWRGEGDAAGQAQDNRNFNYDVIVDFVNQAWDCVSMDLVTYYK